jgi:hypothetical protein
LSTRLKGGFIEYARDRTPYRPAGTLWRRGECDTCHKTRNLPEFEETCGLCVTAREKERESNGRRCRV